MSTLSALREIVSPYAGERVTRIDHASGLTVYVLPKTGYSSCYAVFATKYGSIDTAFEADGQAVEVPPGIAHFLEHKLFESEDGDAFARYAQTGASANAYTSFERTAYLFTGTGDVTPSLEILLDFVQSPYFTEETVQKEMGIIGQEIRMCEDSPGRKVLFNLLRALYHTHPVNIEIAGTVESIADITPALLYGCYRTFYNLRNMVLSVAGNVSVEQVLETADRLLKPAADFDLQRVPVAEPDSVVQARVEEAMPVAAPLFYLGFKQPVGALDGAFTPTQLAAAHVLLELLTGKASPLYARLMAEGLINAGFEAELFDGPSYGVWLFAGESRDPDAVAAAIQAEVDRLREEGVGGEDFRAARNAVYGRLVAALDDVEECGDTLVGDHFYGRAPFALIDHAAALTAADVETLLAESLRAEQSALSVVVPMEEEA